MRANPAVIGARDRLEAVYSQLQETDVPSLPVLDGGRLFGIISLENVTELLRLHRPLGRYAGGGFTGCKDPKNRLNANGHFV